MTDQAIKFVLLQGGQTQSVWVGTDTTVLVIEGEVRLYGPTGYFFAETGMIPEHVLYAEQTWVAGNNGWIDLSAQHNVRVAIIYAEKQGILQRIRCCRAKLNTGFQRIFGQIRVSHPGQLAALAIEQLPDQVAHDNR